MQKPIALIILDGFGYSDQSEGNAVAHAKMPFWNKLLHSYPSTLLNAAGQAVGLLPGYMGNSEVGHMTIGAGRIIPSILSRMHASINDGSFFDNHTIKTYFSSIKETGKSLHLMGLLSDKGVHSHEQHLYALLQVAKKMNLTKVFVHAFLDGRDSPAQSASLYLDRLEKKMELLSCGLLASIHGRFYAMDRDHNWQRTQQSYNLLCNLQPCNQTTQSWQNTLALSYAQGVFDEFVPPARIHADGIISPGDGICFFNIRPDRARQLSQAFINPLFPYFTNPLNTGNNSLAFFLSPVRYQQSFASYNNPILFETRPITPTLASVIQANTPAHNKYSLVAIAETEKYAHVTYFFQGFQENPEKRELRILIPSLKEKDYTHHPEMSASAITHAFKKSIRLHESSFYVVNYANPDMVGHSGDFNATIKACEYIDKQLALLYHEIIDRLDGTMIVTADHGNAERKTDMFGNSITAHSDSKVPFIIINKKLSKSYQPYQAVKTTDKQYGLSNIAPTILSYMNIAIPEEMSDPIVLF